MPGIVEGRSGPRIVPRVLQRPKRRTPIPTSIGARGRQFSGLPRGCRGMVTYHRLGRGEHGDELEDRRLGLRWLLL